MSSITIKESITDNIVHLTQANNTDFSNFNQFEGKISEAPLMLNGHKYRVIDDAIAVKEHSISAWAQKWLLGTAGVVSLAAGAASVAAAVSLSIPLIAVGVIPSIALSIFCFSRISHVTDEDPHTIASLRKDWSPNKQLLAFSSAYEKHDQSIPELKKFMTSAELSYAFDKQFKFANFSDITAKVKLSDAHKFYPSELLQTKWKSELAFSTVDAFFDMYDKRPTTSLDEMRNLGIIDHRDWDLLQPVCSDYKAMDKHFSFQKNEIRSHEQTLVKQCTDTKNLKVRVARLEHEQNFAVSMRRSIMLRHMLSDSDRNNQHKLLELGLDFAVYLAAAAADQALENKLVDARVEHGVELRKIQNDFSERYAQLEHERKGQVSTLSQPLMEAISKVRSQSRAV